ncbi:MAG: glycosyltransferase [Thermoleophilaceae bacterium]
MRVGLVSPYSHSYLGGVGRHVEALAEELIEEGHEVRVFAPYDPDDRLARVMHAGVAPDPRPLPEYVVPISRSVSWGPTEPPRRWASPREPATCRARRSAPGASTSCTCTSPTCRSSPGR